MNNKIKVSVIIPIYNSAIYLNRCLESIINQSLKDIEIICIDDCSKDDSINIIKKFEQIDDRIKCYFNCHNEGAAESRNRGLKCANGEYIQFVDADDWLEYDALEKLYNYATKNNTEMCYLKFKYNNEIENEQYQVGILHDYPEVYSGNDCLYEFVNNNEFFLYLCSVFYLTDFLRKHMLLFKRLRIGEGGEFIIHALFYASRVGVFTDPVYNYRLHSDSVMHEPEMSKNLLIGQIAQYKLLDELLLNSNKTFEAFQKFKENLYRELKYKTNLLCHNDIVDIEDKINDDTEKRYFIDLLGSDKKLKYIISPHIIEEIKKKNRIVLYGAGISSFDIVRQFHRYDIEIFAFAVTSLSGGRKTILGHKIYDIHKLIEYKSEITILVIANKKYYYEIKSTLQNLGFSDYYFL